jgi:hypothetical protein
MERRLQRSVDINRFCIHRKRLRQSLVVFKEGYFIRAIKRTYKSIDFYKIIKRIYL